MAWSASQLVKFLDEKEAKTQMAGYLVNGELVDTFTHRYAVFVGYTVPKIRAVLDETASVVTPATVEGGYWALVRHNSDFGGPLPTWPPAVGDVDPAVNFRPQFAGE